MTLKMLTDLFGAYSPHVNILCLSPSLPVRVSGDCQSNLKLIRLSVPRPSCQLMDSPKDIQGGDQERERERDNKKKKQTSMTTSSACLLVVYIICISAFRQRDKAKGNFISDDVVVDDDVFEIIIALYAVTLLLLLSIIVAIRCFTSNYLPPLPATFLLILPFWHIYLYFNFFFNFCIFILLASDF